MFFLVNYLFNFEMFESNEHFTRFFGVFLYAVRSFKNHGGLFHIYICIWIFVFVLSKEDIKIRRCGMIAEETTIHQSLNEVYVSRYVYKKKTIIKNINTNTILYYVELA